jgi:hypothetical protein
VNDRWQCERQAAPAGSGRHRALECEHFPYWKPIMCLPSHPPQALLRPWGIVLRPAVGAILMSASTVICAINARMLRLK